ncbi:putative uncharacterized protein [Clostridium sp. CAG:440]|jgi:hypothetical protein|nr:putative uncharacterized protein [Clostridium sp. CAG:440]HJJ16427.1 hypothetical protein [Clostridiaceae bacterium]
MGDTLITVVAIVLAATLMFVFPLMTMSNRADDVSQLSVQSLTTQFVDDVRTTGKITSDKYNKFVENIHSTGNTYDVEIEVKVRDENPGKKTTQANSKKIGEDVYYSIYTTQIENTLKNNNAYNLKEGDIVSVSVKNTNTTMSQQLSGGTSTGLTGTIAGEASGIVTANGN